MRASADHPNAVPSGKAVILEEAAIEATFGAAPGDWATLSKGSRVTLEAIYRHPLAHNLGWKSVIALFEAVGTVEHKPNDELAFGLGGEHHRMRKPHGKDLEAAEVMQFRHMLTRAGWAPHGAVSTLHPGTATPALADLLVVLDHHEARLFHLEVGSPALADHVIRPHEPHVVLHDADARRTGQRTLEDSSFYERTAQALALVPARAIVLIVHGAGHANAAHHLVEYLERHHPDTARKVVREIVADLSHLTAPQLLDLGRRALTSHASASPD